MQQNFLGGIDFLEIKALGPLNPDIYELMNSKKLGHGNKQQCYEQMVDLEELGYPLVLHYNNRWNGESKFQVKNVGERGFKEILDALWKAEDADPLSQEVMRLDVKVDVDYPVRYFKEHARVPYKRNKEEWGCLKHKESNAKQVETLEIGKRPNLWRFYDKVAERRHDYKVYSARMKKLGKGIESFEEHYGHPDSGLVLTRVERQFGGGRVPDAVNTLEKLICSAETFTPFDGIDFLPAVTKPPISEKIPLLRLMACNWMSEKTVELGRQGLEAWIRQRSGSNASRFIKTYGHYMATSPLTPPNLNAIFKQEFLKQLNS